MRKPASKLELFIDSLIPFAIFMIIAITIAEIFFFKLVQPYHWVIDVIDLAVIWVFLMDLGFKFRHAKSVPDFLRHYWFYVIAVFPFFLIFRLVEKFYQISTLSSESTIVLGRYIASLLTEARIPRFAELFRFLGISARLVRAFYFYEHPRIRHKINTMKLLGLKTRKKR